MKTNKAVNFIFLFLLVTITVIMGVTHSGSNKINAIDRLGTASDFNEGWYALDKNNISYNVNIHELDFGDSDRLTIYHPYSATTDYINRTLVMRTNNISFVVYAGPDTEKKRVYEYSTSPASFPLQKAPGFAWHFINIPQHLSGGMIQIDVYSHFKDMSEGITSAYYGKSAVILKNLIEEQAVPFFLCIILILVGITYILMHLLFNNLLKIKTQLFYIGLFVLMTSLYSMSHLHIPALFVDNIDALNNFERMMMMVMPLALMIHIENVCDVRKRVLYNIAYAALVLNYIVEILLNIFANINFHRMLFASHIVIIYAGIMIMYTVHNDRKEYKENDDDVKFNKLLLSFSISLFFMSMIIDVMRMYLAPMEDATTFLRFGLMILAACAGIVSIREVSEYSKRTAVSDSIRKMAYTDELTSLSNRASFETKLDEADSEKNHFATIAILVFDVNSLKYVNDNFGHQEGDKLITAAASAIGETFGDGFASFRIGGDEFASVYTGNETSGYIDHQIELFKKRIEEMNIGLPTHLKLSVAVGAAYMSAAGTETITDVFRRADRIMYENKKEMKRLKV